MKLEIRPMGDDGVMVRFHEDSEGDTCEPTFARPLCELLEQAISDERDMAGDPACGFPTAELLRLRADLLYALTLVDAAMARSASLRAIKDGFDRGEV